MKLFSTSLPVGLLFILPFLIQLLPAGLFAESSRTEKARIEKNQQNTRPTPQPSYKDRIVLSDQPVDNIAAAGAGYSFVIAGENHSEYSNHIRQLEIVHRIHQKKPGIVIAMEMFAAKYQDILDKFIESKISEEEFLRESRYFSEWGFDFLLYRDILIFARENRIPVIALNLENDIVRRAGRQSFRQIRPEELKSLPDEIDFGNLAYREYLLEAYQAHGDAGMRGFENFYLAQLLRDEFMSQTAARYMSDHPGKTMIILAGNGHAEYGHGIPSRLERRTGKKCLKVLIDSPYSPGAADYFVYTRDEKFTSTPRLNVMLTEKQDALIISAIYRQPPGEEGKFLVQDKILSINGIPVKSVADVRLILHGKKYGDELAIRLQREEREMEIVYRLSPEKESGESGNSGNAR